MKLNVREYFKLSVIYTIVASLPSLLQTLAQPFTVGQGRLNAIDFSHLAITEIITSFVFVVAAYSMINGIARFYYDYIDDKPGYNKLISSVFNSILLRGILILILAFIIGDYIGKYFSQKELQDFPSYGYASIILGINRAICLTAFALYRNEKNVSRFIMFNVSLAILRTGFQLMGLFFYKMSFIGYVYGGCIGSSITTIAILGYTYYHSGFHLDFKILKSINQFARPLFLYGVIAWAIMYTGRFFLEGNPKELGIYYTAINFAIGIQLILTGIQNATQPEIFRFLKDGVAENNDEIRRLSNMLMAQTQFIVGIMIIPVMIYLKLFYKSDVALASGFITIIFIDYMIKNQAAIFAYPIYYYKKTNILFYINSFSLAINLLLLYFLTPVLKIYGLVIASIVSDLILIISLYYYQKKIVKIHWNLRKLLVFPYIVLFIAITGELLKNILDINMFIISFIIVAVIFGNLAILYKTEIFNIANKLRISLISNNNKANG